MKAKLTLVVLVVAVLALGGVGCNKVTGGGRFIDVATGNKITFGFNAQPTGDGPPLADAKGQFQLIDHGTKTRIHGTFTATQGAVDPSTSYFSGTSSINGEGEYDFWIISTDGGKPGFGEGDSVEIAIGSSNPSDMSWIYHYNGVLQQGNLKVHEK